MIIELEVVVNDNVQRCKCNCERAESLESNLFSWLEAHSLLVASVLGSAFTVTNPT